MKRAGIALALMSFVAVTSANGVIAQEKAAPTGAWIKLCEKAKFKEEEPEKEICITHAELISRAGSVIASAGFRKIEGQEQERMIVRLAVASPVGIAIPSGVQIAVDQGEDRFKLDFTTCYFSPREQATYCVAEKNSEAAWVEKFKKGGKLTVLLIAGNQSTVGIDLPLAGFTAAYDGPPADSTQFNQARAEKIAELRKNFIEEVKKAQAEQAAQQGGEQPKQ